MEWDIYLKNVSEFFRSLKSIKTRLTLFYTLAVFVLLMIFALFLYWFSLHVSYQADYEFLSDEVDTIQYILEDKSNIDALKEAIIESPKQPNRSIYHYFIRVLDNDKKIIAKTPGMDLVLPENQNIHKTTEMLGKKRYYWYENGKTNFLLIQSPINISHHAKPGLIQVALDVSYQHHIVKDRKKLIFILLIGILSSLLIGFLIARRGLRSFYLLTETVHKITTTSLNQRVDPKTLPIELNELGSAFNKMLDRIETSFIRLKQFSADLSHELRTPITNLIGQTEVTLAYDQSVSGYRKVLESNLEEFQRLSSLMENILFLSKAENPRLELKKSWLNIHEEIEMICEFYQAMFDEKSIKVSQSGNASLFANSVMMRRMISNILSNAIKYTPQNGSVAFEIQETTESIQITVSDTGIGIAAEHIPHLFDRFYRIDAARSSTPGTGLGLAIVKSIVELHEGNINIASEINKGTTISITFSSL